MSGETSGESFEPLPARSAGGGGWGRVVPWAFGAAGIGFSAYLFLGPYRTVASDLGRRSRDLAAERAVVWDLTKERDRLAAEAARNAPDPERALRVAKFRSGEAALRARLGGALAARAAVTGGGDRILVSFPEQAIFDGRGADISAAGEAALGLVGGLLKDETGVRVLVSARLDGTPVPAELRDLFPTNWELSAARSVNVVRLLVEEGGVPPRLLLGGARVAEAGDRLPALRRLEIEIAPE